jgi:hypothetical protein
MICLANLLLTVTPFRLPRHLSSYVVGETPLSTTPAVISVLAGYLCLIFGIQTLMAGRQSHKLTQIFRIHNIILSFGSGFLLVLMLEEIIPHLWKHGLYHTLCAIEAWTPVSVPCVAHA